MGGSQVRLAYIIGTYPTLTTTFIDREVRALRGYGMTVEIVSLRRPPVYVAGLDQYADICDGIVYLLPPRIIKLAAAHLYFMCVHWCRYWCLIGYLLSRGHPSIKCRIMTWLHFMEGVYAAYVLRRRRVAHVHAHFLDRASVVALCVGRLLGVSYSITAHANDIYVKPVLLYEKISKAKFTVTVSKYNKTHLVTAYPMLDADKIVVLHPWVDTSSVRPVYDKSDGSKFHIVSVGRLVEKKGHRYLVDACRILKDVGMNVECHIVGEGPLRRELEARVADYGLRGDVRLLGAKVQREVWSELDKADVFVLPCTIAEDGDRDGIPVAVAEAMAMGLPVIATDIVGMHELVRDGAGYLVAPNDSAALARAIVGLEEAGASVRRSMGEVGRRIVAEEFDVEKGTRRLAQMFASIVGNRG